MPIFGGCSTINNHQPSLNIVQQRIWPPPAAVLDTPRCLTVEPSRLQPRPSHRASTSPTTYPSSRHLSLRASAVNPARDIASLLPRPSLAYSTPVGVFIRQSGYPSSNLRLRLSLSRMPLASHGHVQSALHQARSAGSGSLARCSTSSVSKSLSPFPAGC